MASPDLDLAGVEGPGSDTAPQSSSATTGRRCPRPAIFEPVPNNFRCLSCLVLEDELDPATGPGNNNDVMAVYRVGEVMDDVTVFVLALNWFIAPGVILRIHVPLSTTSPPSAEDTMNDILTGNWVNLPEAGQGRLSSRGGSQFEFHPAPTMPLVQQFPPPKYRHISVQEQQEQSRKRHVVKVTGYPDRYSDT